MFGKEKLERYGIPSGFDRDPLFSDLSEPLVKIGTRLTDTRQRFWCWKAPDFFWFWNEDESDFLGVFTERVQELILSFRDANKKVHQSRVYWLGSPPDLERDEKAGNESIAGLSAAWKRLIASTVASITASHLSESRRPPWLMR
ncbi:hypothetical protein IAD21_03572 [Abditibacteriota bacterium]|nr:hypothetical protein IAD21_03572 [Abditibacteriota bacterium]